ncbi:MAG: hypothetical protein HKO64_07850 [Xanthomonadales bacterium]|nr:SPOR domain-containing protein [Gammaproteobacteria bacterium]NNE06724.1 hypothetical protein [Xanthomonadales bacterium]NNL95522.1 hypothetical protein [Xanthomonadales bacterium]
MTSGRRAGLILAIGLAAMLSGTAWANEVEDAQDTEVWQCAEDEIDIGEYCVKVVESEPEQAGTPKATPFRRESMMPGVVRRSSPQPPAETPARKPAVVVRQTIPVPVVAEGGYGIQLGAWSSRETAERVGLSVIESGVNAILSPMQRGDKLLWACIAGPYASEDAARGDLQLLKSDSRFSQAWTKPLKGLRLEGIEYTPALAAEK